VASTQDLQEFNVKSSTIRAMGGIRFAHPAIAMIVTKSRENKEASVGID